MAEFRTVVAVWSDVAGRFTARLCAEDTDYVGYGATAAEAVLQIREVLQETLRDRSDLPMVDRRARAPKPPRRTHDAARSMLDPDQVEKVVVRADIRAIERSDGRVFPADEPIAFRVIAITGLMHGGDLGLCVLPTLGLAFNYLRADRPKLRGLIEHRLREELFGKTVEELVALLPPQEVETEVVAVDIPRPRKAEADDEHPALAAVAEPLFQRGGGARTGRALFREEEIERVATCLAANMSIVLVGPAGAGKTTVLMAAAERAEAHDGASRRRFWRTEASRLIAGMRWLGQWEERLEQALDALADIHGVLCFADVASLLRTGGNAPESSAAAMLLSRMRAGRLCSVGESTPEAWEACRREFPAFAAEFRVVRVAALSERQTQEILDTAARGYASGFRVEVQPGATRLVLDLHARFSPYRAFPGAPAAFQRRVFDRVVPSERATFDKEAVFAQFSEENGLGRELLDDAVTLERGRVEEFFASRVLGQQAACCVAADVVTRLKSGLNDVERPLAVMLFAGPTGVGKTELAKTIAERLFGVTSSKDRLVRIDLSEYQSTGSVDRLIGTFEADPPKWLRTVRRHPFCVVLLDEVEKAAPEIFDLFLALFDEGRLADRYGRVTWFRSAVIVMTTNLGARSSAAVGFNPDASSNYEKAVRDSFRPEFVNRIDHIVAFEPLGAETARALVAKELRALAEREGFLRRQIEVRTDPSLVAHLADVGFDNRLGARPLQRIIEDLVAAPLARHLLENPKLTTSLVTLAWINHRFEIQTGP